LFGLLKGELPFALTPAIMFEYQDVLSRPGILGSPQLLTETEIDVILDALCAKCFATAPWFRFRPFLDDPKDDFYFECALASGARVIVSDDKHFRHPAVAAFGIDVLDAPAFERKWRKRTEE
jgi:predicted nucleic acid-binding protein